MSSVSNRTHNVACGNYQDGVSRIRQTFGESDESHLLEFLWYIVALGRATHVSFWDSALVCMVTMVPDRKYLRQIVRNARSSDPSWGSWEAPSNI